MSASPGMLEEMKRWLLHVANRQRIHDFATVRIERVDAMADSIDSLRGKATDYVDHSRERATELARTFEDMVRERPLTAILAAMAVGFVLGCFMTRR